MGRPVMLRVAAALVAFSQLALAVPALAGASPHRFPARVFYCFNILYRTAFCSADLPSMDADGMAPGHAARQPSCLLASAGTLARAQWRAGIVLHHRFMLVLGRGSAAALGNALAGSALDCELCARSRRWSLLGRQRPLAIFHWVGLRNRRRDRALRIPPSASRIAIVVTQQNLRLADNEAALRKALDSILDPLCIIDLRTQRYINVNEEFLVATGYTREEAIGKRWQELNIWFDETSADAADRARGERSEGSQRRDHGAWRRRIAGAGAGFIGGAGTGRPSVRAVHRARCLPS